MDAYPPVHPPDSHRVPTSPPTSKECGDEAEIKLTDRAVQVNSFYNAVVSFRAHLGHL
jgi:hypothetical protein